MASLFFSYSHKDETLRNELETHLAMLKREGTIEAWHDRKIMAGDDFGKSISTEMEKADVILLLVSPDFLASKYFYEVEFQRAMERNSAGSARAIAVILRPCEWQRTALAQFLVTPRDGKPVTKWPNLDDAFLDITKQIRRALPKAADAPNVQRPAAAVAPVMSAPRSSNLRIRQQFTDADKDQFLDDAFEFMARFFEGSLDELGQRHADIEGRFKRIDAHSFSAIIYRDGEKVARCAIRHGGSRGFGSGITFSHEERSSTNSYSEGLNLVVGEQSLSLKPTGMRAVMGGQNRETTLTSEGAAEYYWSMLIEPLQR